MGKMNRVYSEKWTMLMKIKWTIAWRKKKCFCPALLTVKRLAEELKGERKRLQMKRQRFKLGGVC